MHYAEFTMFRHLDPTKGTRHAGSHTRARALRRRDLSDLRAGGVVTLIAPEWTGQQRSVRLQGQSRDSRRQTPPRTPAQPWAGPCRECRKVGRASEDQRRRDRHSVAGPRGLFLYELLARPKPPGRLAGWRTPQKPKVGRVLLRWPWPPPCSSRPHCQMSPESSLIRALIAV
jgi:hypothetical protein